MAWYRVLLNSFPNTSQFVGQKKKTSHLSTSSVKYEQSVVFFVYMVKMLPFYPL